MTDELRSPVPMLREPQDKGRQSATLRTALIAGSLTALAMGAAWFLSVRPRPGPTTPAAAAVPSRAADDDHRGSNLTGEQAIQYALSHAKELIATWSPLSFKAELAAYDPDGPTKGDEVVNPAFNDLERSACRGNEVWRRAEAFHDRMGEIPNAVATPKGPVLYEGVWEKGEWGRSAFIGVRVRDHACGAFDMGGEKPVIDGDGDVVAVLAAAAAIRTLNQEADRSAVPHWARDQAILSVDDVFAAMYKSPQPAGADGPKVFGSSAFQALIAGKSKQQVIALLGRPIAVHDGLAVGSQSYDYSPAEPYLGPVNFRVKDDVTGLVHRSVTVEFSATGSALGVRF